MGMCTVYIYEKSHEAQIALKQKKMKNVHPAVGITFRFNSTVYKNSLESSSLSLCLCMCECLLIFAILIFVSEHN